MKNSLLAIAALLFITTAMAQTNKIEATGNVGIGTLTPAQKLEVANEGPAYIQLTNTRDVLGPVGALKFNMAGTEVSAIEAERVAPEGRQTLLKFFVKAGPGFKEGMRLSQDGNLAIGGTAPLGRLHVTSPPGVAFAKFTPSNIPVADAFISIENNTSITDAFIPSIRARSFMSGRPFGFALIGEADDIVPPSHDSHGGAITLDGRSKNGTRLYNNNVLMVNTYGQNLVAVKGDGSVGIGTTDTKGYKLAVNGSAIFTKVKVKAYDGWPDYVFGEDYELLPIHELASYVRYNRHLPDVPSASEIEKEGIDVGEMNKQLLKKIEELTLYVIQLKQENDAQQEIINELQQIIKK